MINQPIWYTQQNTWYYWNYNKKCWTQANNTELLNLYREHEASIEAPEINIVNHNVRTQLLEAMKLEGIKTPPKEAPKEWIQFKDKIIDINTLYQFDPTPEYIVPNIIPWELGTDMNTPTIDQIFTEWVGDRHKPLLYEIMAYTLYRDIPLNRWFILNGGGANGKGSYIDIILKFLGTNNISEAPLYNIATNKFYAYELYQKLANISCENSIKPLPDTAQLKKLTSGDYMSFDIKHRLPIHGRSYATIIISCNTIPETLDKSDAFYRRIQCITFPNQFTEKKDILSTIPKQEFNNLATKCIQILKEILQYRKFTHEGTIEDRRKAYEELSNPLARFMRERTTPDPTGHIFKFELRDKYNIWLKERHLEGWNEKRIGERMSLETQKVWYQDSDKRYNAWMGIKWKQAPIDYERLQQNE